MGTASGNSTWQNSPSVATPITAARLEAIEGALDTNAASIAALPALADVATSGSYTDLTDTPTLGTAAATNTDAYATTAQGALAATAVQPGDLAAVATTGDPTDLAATGTPDSTTYLRGDGTWATPPTGIYIGATAPEDTSLVWIDTSALEA